jgi:hypothetical protein
MNRRQFALLLPAAALLAGCDTDQKPDHAATLLNNSGVQNALKALSDAIEGLESDDVGGFEGENWREVVPDVESPSSEVRDALEKLRQELGVQGS